MSDQSKIVPARTITPLIRLIRDVRVILTAPAGINLVVDLLYAVIDPRIRYD